MIAARASRASGHSLVTPCARARRCSLTLRFLFAVALVGCTSDPVSVDAGARLDTGVAVDAAADTGVPPSDADDGVDAPGCAPTCGDAECGDDGCGGSCGPCEAGESCAEGMCGPRTFGCPPSAPFGTAEGDVAADAVLFDCDGNEVALHTLCDAEVSWVFEFADWCPPCRGFARDDVQRIWAEYSARGVEGYFVVSADGSFNAPTQSLCNEVRDRYGLTMPVLFDPTGALQTALGINATAWNSLVQNGMVIDWKGKYAEAEVEGELASRVPE